MKLLFLLLLFIDCRRIENHLIVKDYVAAIEEAKVACQSEPESLLVLETAMKAFSRGGKEEEALQTFYQWQKVSPEKPPRRIYEELGWGIIQNGELSSSPLIRTMSLLAAFWGQDARGIKMIERR